MRLRFFHAGFLRYDKRMPAYLGALAIVLLCALREEAFPRECYGAAFQAYAQHVRRYV
jgi:hypothetical protein